MSSCSHRDGELDPVLRYAPPRARAQGQIPPDSTIPPADRSLFPQPRDTSEFCGDRAIVEMRQRLALEPEWIPEPPQDAVPRLDVWRLALQASIAFTTAAGVAWVVVWAPGVSQLAHSFWPTESPRAALTGTRTTVPPSGTITPVPARSVTTLSTAEPAMRDATEQSETSAPAPTTPVIDAANAQPPVDLETALTEHARRVSNREPATTSRATAPDFVTRQLDRDELAAMLRRAGDFIKSGDLSSARLLLRRAAEAGSEEAALTLAGTFDPNVLAARGFQDGAADIGLARLWYERAAQFGSSEAPRRLRQLANISPQ
jgi:hypothetical protein